jgi:hypothetical protein
MIVKESDYICPGCKSHNTSQPRPAFIAASGIVFIGIGAWTFSIPVLGFVFVVAGGIMLVISPFLRNIHICNMCKKIWKIKPVKKIPAEKIIDFMERSQKYKRNKEEH